MKNTLYTCVLIGFSTCFSLSSHAANQGSINYKKVTNVHAMLGEKQKAMKAFIPKEKTDYINVEFNQNLYRIIEKKPDNTPKDKVTFKAITVDKNSVTIVDTKLNEQKSFGKLVDLNYVLHSKINSETKPKATTKQKEILGYSAKAVTLSSDHFKGEATVWYTEDIKGRAAPIALANVPGVILAIESNSINYQVESIHLKPISQGQFIVPSNYREISAGQFQDLQEEAQEDLFKKMGNGVRVIRSEDK